MLQRPKPWPSNKRSHCNEKATHDNEEQPLLTTTREKARHAQQEDPMQPKINKFKKQKKNSGLKNNNKMDNRGPAKSHRELCSILCGSLDGRGVRGRMDTGIQVSRYGYVSLSPFTVLLKLSQHCQSAIPQYKIKRLFKNEGIIDMFLKRS